MLEPHWHARGGGGAGGGGGVLQPVLSSADKTIGDFCHPSTWLSHPWCLILPPQGNTKNDCWIFALAVLLSSLLVYNSKGTVDQYAMEQLQYPFHAGELCRGVELGPPACPYQLR